ncbi:GntR family transcriptional regulator [Vallitalea sediminicola]
MNNNNLKIDKDSPVPIYYQIANNIKTRIINGEWNIGERIPSEFEFTSEYNVSRVTIRQSLANLEKDNIIYKIRGKGVYVKNNASPLIHELGYPADVGTKMRQQGTNITSEILVLEIDKNKIPNIKSKLKLDEKDKVVYIKRIFSLDGIPISLSRAWLPLHKVPDIIEKGLISNRLSITLKNRYGYVPYKIENFIEANTPALVDMKLLNADYNTPTITFNSISYIEDGLPLEYSKVIWLGDKVKFHFNVQKDDNNNIIFTVG